MVYDYVFKMPSLANHSNILFYFLIDRQYYLYVIYHLLETTII